MNIERLKLVQELVRLTAEVKDAPKLERIKKTGRIIAILKMLGAAVAELPEKLVINSDEELARSWQDFINGDYGNDYSPRSKTNAIKLKRAAKLRFFKVAEEYFAKAHPTVLVARPESDPWIYQYEGGGKWRGWSWDDSPDVERKLTEITCDGERIVTDFLHAKLGELEIKAEDLAPLHGAPRREDFYPDEAKEPTEWDKDRETLQSIIDGKHEDMRLPALYDAIAAIDARQKDNPEYPEQLEKALDAWQKVILDMTAKITG